jgi:hypothetical protein
MMNNLTPRSLSAHKDENANRQDKEFEPQRHRGDKAFEPPNEYEIAAHPKMKIVS